MAVDKTKDIQVGGTLHSIATGNVIAHADEIMDEDYGKKQSIINQELSNRLTEELKGYLPLTGGTLTGGLTINDNVTANGYSIPDKFSTDLLNASGSTTSISDILAEVPAPDLSSYATKDELNGYLKSNMGIPMYEVGYQEINFSDKGHVRFMGRNGSYTKTQSSVFVYGKYSSTNLLGIYLDSGGVTNAVPKSQIRIGRFTGISAEQIPQIDASIPYLTLDRSGIRISDKTTSDLLNAGGSTTSISDIATQVQAAIVDSAPEALDTLNELAAALGDDPNFAATITTQIGQKADAIHTHNVADITGLSDVATSGDYNDLSNTPTIPTYSLATSSQEGLLSSTDKSRLDTIYQQLTALNGVSHIAEDQAFTQSEGNLVFNFSCIKPTDAENNKSIHSVAIPMATTEAAGVMTAEDKNRLNTIQQQLTVKSTITWVELD